MNPSLGVEFELPVFLLFPFPVINFPLENEKERINISWQPNPQGAGSSLFSYTSHGAEESFQDGQSQS